MIMRICPICNQEYFERPAISRRRKAEICPDCGTKEAMDAAGWDNEQQEEVFKLIQQFKGGITRE